MKKSTLLALGALLIGSAASAEVVTIGGLKAITDIKNDTPVYYKVSNMRAQALNYVNGQVTKADGQVYMTDNSTKQVALPAVGPDGKPTPQISSMPYMGLAPVQGKFFCAFSAQPEVMSEHTIYWYFEAEVKKGVPTNKLLIRNAVIDGALKNASEVMPGLGRKSMAFSETTKQAYYVVKITEEQIAEYLTGTNDEGEEVSIDPAMAEIAYAFSTEEEVTNTSNSCLDVNNYIAYSYKPEPAYPWYVPNPSYDPEYPEDAPEFILKQGANAETALNEDGTLKAGYAVNPAWTEDMGEEWDPNDEESVPHYATAASYGFAGVDRTWSPLRGNGSNLNHIYNNGSLFTVAEVTDNAAVEAAKKAYEEVKTAAYREAVEAAVKAAKDGVVSQIAALANVPALYGGDAKATRLEQLITAVNAVTADPTKVTKLEDVEVETARVEALIARYKNEAITLAGNNTVVKIKQLLGLRDWATAYDTEGEDNVNNTYLSIGEGNGVVKLDGVETEVPYDALECITTPDNTSLWTMEYVEGQGYRLKNNNKYIRVFGDWLNLLGEQGWSEALGLNVEDLEEGAGLLDGCSWYNWAVTDKAEEAAVFTFTPCADPAKQSALSEAQQEILNNEDYLTFLGYMQDGMSVEEAIAAATSIINNVHFTAPNENGDATYLFRDNANQGYRVISYPAEGNRWYAESGCFQFELVSEGTEINAINEIVDNAVKAQGIYDLQGRRVSKATKGMYIINGVKTIVK